MFVVSRGGNLSMDSQVRRQKRLHSALQKFQHFTGILYEYIIFWALPICWRGCVAKELQKFLKQYFDIYTTFYIGWLRQFQHFKGRNFVPVWRYERGSLLRLRELFENTSDIRAGFSWCEALGFFTCDAPSPTVTRKQWTSVNQFEQRRYWRSESTVNKNSKSLLQCPTINAFVATFDAKAFNDTELLKSLLGGEHNY